MTMPTECDVAARGMSESEGFIKHNALHRQWQRAVSCLRGMHLQVPCLVSLELVCSARQREGLEPNTVAWNLAAAASGRCQEWQITLRHSLHSNPAWPPGPVYRLLRSANAADEIT